MSPLQLVRARGGGGSDGDGGQTEPHVDLLAESRPSDLCEADREQDRGQGIAAVEGRHGDDGDASLRQVDRLELLAPGDAEVDWQREFGVRLIRLQYWQVSARACSSLCLSLT